MLDIIPFETKLETKICSFLTGSLFNPFATYGVSQDLYVSYVLSELSDIVSKGGFVLVAHEYSEVVGLISLNRSEWDSQHFNVEMSKICQLLASGDYLRSIHIKQRLVSSLVARCSKELLLHVSARVNKEELSSIHALENKNFRLMDVLITSSLDLRKHPRIPAQNQYSVRKSRPDEVPRLEKMAFECFAENVLATDRFHADPTLSKRRSSELYAKWLVNSSEGASNEVLVAEMDGKPVGFNICNINIPLSEAIGLRVGTMVLTAVDSSARNRGVATSLLNSSLEWFADKVDVVETGGQVSNYAIQRAWCDVGLKIVRSHCTFHWSVLTESL